MDWIILKVGWTLLFSLPVGAFVCYVSDYVLQVALV